MASDDRDIEPFDLVQQIFGRRDSKGFPDIFRGFDEMKRKMVKEFNDTIRNIETKASKDLVREYGPFVYGYSMTICPYGKPKVRKFGNIKSPFQTGRYFRRAPMISSEREPLADVTTTDKEVKMVIEIPGVSKENIKVNIYDNSLEVSITEGSQRGITKSLNYLKN
jgi:HSP20 family protein